MSAAPGGVLDDVRPAAPRNPSPGAKAGSPDFVHGIGRMYHPAGLTVGERCRWCSTPLAGRARRNATHLECPRCDAPADVAEVAEVYDLDKPQPDLAAMQAARQAQFAQAQQTQQFQTPNPPKGNTA